LSDVGAVLEFSALLLLEFFLIILHFVIDNLEVVFESFEEGAPVSVSNLLPTLVDSEIVD
jgi:hypothetical protein